MQKEVAAKSAPETARPLCRLLRKAEIQRITGLAHSTLYDMIRRGSFPPPVKLSERYVAWREDEFLDWLNSRPKPLGPKATAELSA